MWKYIHADWSETHEHKTDRLTPDFRQTQTLPDTIIISFVIFATRVDTIRP
jgi:hypothetical protein